jgi:hypothetical protein
MRQHRTAAPFRTPWRRVTSIVALCVGALSGAGWGTGCSVIYDLETQQCESTADCTAMGGVFSDLECVNNLCQLPAITGCQSNAECIDQEGDGFRPYACIDRACVSLLSSECPTMLPQENEVGLTNLREDDDTLILAGTGVIDDTAVLDVRLMNYDLALTELETYVGGLGAGGRQVVMLGCKATYDSNDELDRMMTHLVDELKVPGLVAAMGADDLQRAWTEKGDAANLFFMSPLESDPTLATLMDRGLMWHIGPGADVVARAYAPLLTRVIDHLAVAGTVKVATVLTPDYRFLNNVMLTVESPPAQYGLLFNGMSVAQNRSAGNYRGVSISADADESAATQVQDLVTFQPTVIVSAADTKFLQAVVPAIEADWPVGVAKPFYLLSPFNYNDAALQDLIANERELASRMLGVNWAAAPDSTAYDAYVGRWQFAYPENRDDLGYENFYDAAYYLIYAAAAAGQNLQSGANIAQGMSRLLTGPAYSVGPDRMGQAMGILSVPSASIELDGTLGPPNFNLDGTRNAPGSIWCIDSAGVFHPDWLRYVPGAGDDPTQATLTSGIAASCVDGF